MLICVFDASICVFDAFICVFDTCILVYDSFFCCVIYVCSDVFYRALCFCHTCLSVFLYVSDYLAFGYNVTRAGGRRAVGQRWAGGGGGGKTLNP